jgi:DNA repair protein RecO (recombination protein O)
MTLSRTYGIVLKIAAHGESDKLVTLYSYDLGRVTGIAKGAKRSRQRFVNKLEEFSLLQILYRPPRGPAGLLLISEAELLCAHLSLRKVFQRYVAAMYISELLLRFTRDNDPDPRLYSLLQWALISLDKADSPQKIAALYHLQLLAAVGYRPELQRCSNCRHPVGPGRTFLFIPGSGSLLCSSCHHQKGPHYNRLSIQALKFLASAQLVTLERLNRLQLSGQTAAEAMDALYHYTFHLLQQDIHSWQAMRTLNITPTRKSIMSSSLSHERTSPAEARSLKLDI